MFNIEWFWVYWLINFHISGVAFTLYMHRGIGHRMCTFSPFASHILRFILWIGSKLGPQYVETYAVKHRKHHACSDSPDDPQSPFYLTFRQQISPWKLNEEDLRNSDIRSPNDWIERTLYIPYYKHGHWVVHLIAGLFFGIWGFVLSYVVRMATYRWLGITLGNILFHKIGFTYAGNKHPTDRSRNLLPWGILMAGEELHANHHNDSTNPNYRQRWFEIDIGYIYACILSKLGMLQFTRKKL